MGRLPRGVVWTLLLSILIGQSVAQGDFGPPDSYDLDLGSTPADIVFVVDTSGFSNSTESLNQEVAVKGFLTGFLENADINSGNVKVAMVTYSTHPKVIFDLNKYSTKTDMEDAVFLADFEEEEPRERNLADALSLVRTKILVRDRRDAPNFVLLLMSGKSDRNSVRTLQEADGLKFARANIFGIGISLDDDDAEEMFEVSSKPTMENTFLISSVYELEMLRELVFMQIFARAEQAFKAPAAGSETLDLAFLLHYSNSVSREDFQRILDFMKNILQYSDIDDDKLRVGAVVFRKRGIPLFDFNNYYSQEEVFGGIDQINYNYRSKTSSIASGFDTVRTSLFTRTGGEREPAPNLVILITDSNADTDVDQTITAVERMKADGAAVYVVGINVTYPEELLSIASNPSYNVLVKDASELEGHDEQFHNDFVALRAKGFPVVIPALESSTSGTFADTTPVSTQNSDEAEIVFLVHASKKTTTKDFKNNLIQYIIGIIQRADTTKNKFGVVMYGDSPEVVLKLTSFPKAKLVKKALKKIKPNKRSKRADLLKALSFVREQVFNGDDPNLPNGIVLIRDQKSKRVDDNHLGTELSLLEASGTNLFQIGIGQQVENDKESELVTNTFGDDSVTNVGSYGELSNSPEVVKLLSRKIRSFHQEEIDLIIAVHTQHNTALKNVKKHIQVLLKDILSAVDINSGAVQVSIVTFGAKTKVHFPLNAFNKDKKLMKAFKKIKRKEYRSKGSDLMTLLTTLESDVLTPHSGDRQGVENLILVITDSASSSDLNMLKQKAEEMKKGNTIFAIGVDSANNDELKALASSPENEFFYKGKKYDDLTKSPELREQMIRNVKIFESLTVPATTKPKKTTPKPKVTKADTTTTTPYFKTTTRSIEIETTRMTTRQRLFTTTTTPVGPSRFYVPLSVSEVADIVLLVHLSPRITEMEFITVQEFLKSLVSRADIANGKAQIGLVFYGADPEIIFHINQYNDIALMQKSIDGMRADLRSYTSDASTAIASAKQMLSPYFNRRDDVPAAMIFIADDPANTNFDVMKDERDRAIEDEIRILTVGIGVSDKSKLESLASDPDFIMNYDNVWMLNDAENDLTEKIFAFQNDGVTEDKLFEETTLAATTTTPADTTVFVEIITKSDGIVLELPSSLAGCGLAKTDLVFILDASTSVTDANFQKMRDFLKEFLSNADIDSGSVRVGVNIYSTDVQVEFHLNRYTKAADVMSAIDNIPYIYGSTNTADALQSMANVMFTPQNGDRPDAPNVCILLTDGVSNINSRRTIPEAERARAKNVHLYVIGIGLTDTREVTAIATPPASKNLFSVNSFDELKGLHKTILNTATCKDEISEPPVADAGSDRTIQLPLNSITLSGDGSRDDVGIVRYEWSQLSGPRVNVRDTNDPMLSVDRLTEGVYEFELNVTDVDGQSDTDTVVITVLPEPDLPPRADAGPDKQVKLPNDRVTLSGRGSSDDKRITRWVWRLVNGNARGVTMSGQNTDTLDLSRLQEGTYTFGLTVYDAKGQMDEDEVTITVAAAPDAPPVANAGLDYIIQLPDDSVTLDGSRSSDDVRVITYSWRMTQGYPSSVRMSGERTPRLNVNGLSEGEYVFTLTVTDGKGQLDEDEARVIVKKAPRVEGYDVIFVLDSSVTPEHFRWMNNYTRAVVREMSIDDGEFRVGYLIYSNSAYRQFDLQDYGTRSDVLSAIDKVGYRPGTKNTAAALKYARKQMFTPSKGDRDYAKNYLILLTGDNPSDDPFGAATEACQLQAEGVGMFGVGFGDFSNRDELTAYSSVPNDDYQSIMRQESDQGEMPGLMLYNLKKRTPRPSACPVVVTTPYNGDCFASGDIVFILDSSGSVGQDNFYRVLNFTYSTIDGLDIDSGHFRVGVTTFSDSSRLDFNLNDFSNKQDIHDALTQRVRYMYGNTHTAHALRRARLEMFQLAAGDRPDVPNVIVIITDGQSNINHEMTIPEARHLKAAGVTIITLAVGFTSETSELVGLTSPPISENLVYTEDYESLSKVKDKLIEPLCHDSNMCRSSPCQNGGVCMDGIRSYICICPDDFFGDTCSKHCGEPSDVVIVLDSSNTVGEYNFGRLKEYSEHLVREMNKDSCDVNIGFMKYSSNAMVQVHLGTYDDTETNVRAVEQISYSRGRANMAAAFRSLRTEMFNGRRGDRPGARNIAYFLTDGTNDAESEMAESEAEQAISSGIRIVPIGINLRERFELDNIAEKQNLNVIEINDEPALIENTDVILRPLYEGSNDYCAENPCSNGGQCVNEPFGYSCECDIGYTGDTCTQRCSAKGDVVFAVDTSRYVTRKELKSIRRFLRSVVKRLKFNKNEFSVGMVQFTDWAQVSLTLSQGKSKKAVRKSIAGLRVHGGDPQPSIALAKAKYRIFDAYGEDKDRPNYLILITKSMRGEEDILTEANKLKLEGTRILGVGLGLTANEREYLESSVSIPFRETAMFADDRKEMDDLADRVVEYMCDDENLCAENPCRNGGVCQRLGGDFYCDCGVGYAGRYCENTCNARADIVFLLDSSGSIGHKDFRRVKKFVHNMVSDLQIGKDASRIGLATYSSKSRHGFFMSKYDDLFKLQNAIAGISYEYGNSNAAEGLRLVREHYFNGRNGDRSDIQDFLVVITDGVSNVQPDQTLIEANLIKEKGVHVYAVGIGEFDPAELNEIASKPASENAYILSDYSGLDNISNSIIKQTCRDPSVCDENPCRNGGVCVPGINGLFCECRRGYRGVHCEESCVSVKDIFFLLDSSDSVGTQNFEQAKKFINNIIEEFSSKDSFNRFSLLTYSDEVQIVFSLGRYNSLNIIQNAVKYARYRPGNTNTASALRVVDELSTEDLGDRYDAENIVFVITDGTGNVNEDDTIAAADNIKNKGARVITVGINMDDPSEVESMASSKRDSFKINKYDDLEGVLEEVVQNTCKNGNVIEKK